MVKQRMDLLELVRNPAEDADLDFLREAMGVLVQAIMEAEVAVQIGAEHGERSPGRLTQRNGYRPRPGTRGWARWSSRSPGCARAVTFRRSSSRVGGASEHCSPLCSRPMWRASPRGR